MSTPAVAGDQPVSTGSIDFDIPAQPLADALVAYGAVTGQEVYYDGALAQGRQSAPLKGRFSPALGLKTLLQGTGYLPRVAGPDIFTLVAEPRVAVPPIPASDVLIREYEPYLGALQTRVVDALCGIDAPAANEIIFSFWIDPSGVIARAEILDSSGDPARDAAISAGLRGLDIGRQLPSGLPQPVTMAVYPPSAGEASGCAAPTGARADN